MGLTFKDSNLGTLLLACEPLNGIMENFDPANQKQDCSTWADILCNFKDRAFVELGLGMLPTWSVFKKWENYVFVMFWFPWMLESL